METLKCQQKVTIVGAGYVGATTAFSLLAKDLVEEIALVDLNEKLVQSQVMDLQHAMPFWGSTRVKVGGDQDFADSDIAVIACGANQKPGETRLDLLKKNAAIIRSLLPTIFKVNPDIIVLMVTNPVDLLTTIAIQDFPQHQHHIFGSGTVLDSARLRQLLGSHLHLNPQSIHAYIVGEHGDSELPLWSCATIGGASLDSFRLTEKVRRQIFEQAKNAAYAIIEGKQATYYAIGAAVAWLCHIILENKQTVVPISHMCEGKFGIRKIALSLPRVLGRNGVGEIIPLTLTPKEREQLIRSACSLQTALKTLKR